MINMRNSALAVVVVVVGALLGVSRALKFLEAVDDDDSMNERLLSIMILF